MRGVKSTIVTVLATAAAGTLGVATPAGADTGVPFTITEAVNLREGGVDTFTATGPLCSSGTFVDTVVAAGVWRAPIPKENLLIRTTYTCDDGSGTFDILKHVPLSFSSEGFTNSGPVQIVGGTGAYSGWVGHATDSGIGYVNPETGQVEDAIGQITGFITPAGSAA